ncbi:MAG: LysR family transcriptional regulator [Arthrobacter sp.]|jgi:DNA-binding transcriptional LysR family regulator|nr:LysR family transcriptional regulator [Arthrobacter sp.]
MELRELRYFQAVVEAGSITAAAHALHMSQPPLSVAISKLEASLGVQLLVRTPRGVEPTSAGRHLLGASARVLGEVERLQEELRDYGRGTRGVLRLAAVPALLWSRVPRLLRAYAEAAPGVEVRLSDPPPWTAIDRLLAAEVDAACVMVADGEAFARRYRDSLEVHPWGEVPLRGVFPRGAVTPAGGARGADGANSVGSTNGAGGDSADSADSVSGAGGAVDPYPLAGFSEHTLLIPQRTAAVPSLPEAVEATLRRHRVTPRAYRTVETIQTALPLIEAGAGAAILPDPDGEGLGRFDVEVRELRPEPAPLSVLVLTRPGAGESAMVGGFLGQLSRNRRRNRV